MCSSPNKSHASSETAATAEDHPRETPKAPAHVTSREAQELVPLAPSASRVRGTDVRRRGAGQGKGAAEYHGQVNANDHAAPTAEPASSRMGTGRRRKRASRDPQGRPFPSRVTAHASNECMAGLQSERPRLAVKTSTRREGQRREWKKHSSRSR